MNDGQFDASRRGARREEELDPLPFSAVKNASKCFWDVQTALRALCTQITIKAGQKADSRLADGIPELLSVRLVYAAVALTGGPHVFADAVVDRKVLPGELHSPQPARQKVRQRVLCVRTT